MNLLDQLIRQLNILIEIVDELLKSIKNALDKQFLSEIELNILNEAVDVSKSFMENYNKFLSEIDIEK